MGPDQVPDRRPETVPRELPERRPKRASENRPAGPRGPALVIIISGPSGVGKDAVIEQLRERGHPFHYTITATTRAPRWNERHGVNYFFYRTEEFERRIVAGEFIEHSLVYDHYYGVPRDQIERALASGLDVVIKPDVQGAAKLRRVLPDAVLIFLAPESLGQLVEQMAQRQTESGEAFAQRLDTAQFELAQIELFDYLVVNRQGRLSDTVDCVEAILRAEKCRVARLRSPRDAT